MFTGVASPSPAMKGLGETGESFGKPRQFARDSSEPRGLKLNFVVGEGKL